jgi:hypothetical protein
MKNTTTAAVAAAAIITAITDIPACHLRLPGERKELAGTAGVNQLQVSIPTTASNLPQQQS